MIHQRYSRTNKQRDNLRQQYGTLNHDTKRKAVYNIGRIWFNRPVGKPQCEHFEQRRAKQKLLVVWTKVGEAGYRRCPLSDDVDRLLEQNGAQTTTELL